jgi:Leucine-rich repeat (LRR) protein
MLQALVVANNSLSGTIPSNIGDRFHNIENLKFAVNQFHGTIPPSLSNLSAITNLQLSTNSFVGHVPCAFGRLKGLVILYLEGNKLEANDTEGWEFITQLANCSQLQQLTLVNNSFTGKLPSSITNLSTTLQYLDLSDNRISGFIPSSIGYLVGLQVLVMANISISGVIPESIGHLQNLAVLGLYNTNLSGLVPLSLGNLTRLNILLVYNGSLEGPIPATLGNLKNVYILDLSNNRLNGSIPREALKLPALSDYPDLSYNLLSGHFLLKLVAWQTLTTCICQETSCLAAYQIVLENAYRWNSLNWARTRLWEAYLNL